VALVAGELGCPFPRDLDLKALLDHREADSLSPVEREPKAVEAWSHVGAGGRDLYHYRSSGAQHLLTGRLCTHRRFPRYGIIWMI
jgi:hypothetical protein